MPVSGYSGHAAGGRPARKEEPATPPPPGRDEYGRLTQFTGAGWKVCARGRARTITQQ